MSTVTAPTRTRTAGTADVRSWALDGAGVRFCVRPVLVFAVPVECWRRLRVERRCPPCRAFTDRVRAETRRLRGLP